MDRGMMPVQESWMTPEQYEHARRFYPERIISTCIEPPCILIHVRMKAVPVPDDLKRLMEQG